MVTILAKEKTKASQKYLPNPLISNTVVGTSSHHFGDLINQMQLGFDKQSASWVTALCILLEFHYNKLQL